MITKRPVTEPLNRRRPLAVRTPVPAAPIAMAAGVLALTLVGVGATSDPAASSIAVGGDRVVSVAFASPLPATDDSGGSDDSGADYGPSAPPMSAPCGDPSCSRGSSSSSSGSGGGGGSTSVSAGGGSEDDPGSGGISGFIKKVLGGASDAAGSAAGAGSQAGGSSGEDGAGLASKIVSSVVDGVRSMLSQLGSGGN